MQDDDALFLKAIIPSRKATKLYLGARPTSMKVDPSEKALLESVARGEWKSVGGKSERMRYARTAKATCRKGRRLKEV